MNKKTGGWFLVPLTALLVLAPLSGGFSSCQKEWLGAWQNRVQIRVDYSKIDSPLVNFPVLVHLSPASGINSFDLSQVFDTLRSDSNRNKMALTASDGTSQCYVEIESWDSLAKEAWLWVKVPLINSGADTILYLYFDINHADNTAYVGTVGSSAAKSVWNDDYVGVWHMEGSYRGTKGEVKDSTAFANNGTAGGTGGYPVRQSSVDGFGQYFSGNDGVSGGTRPYIKIPESPNYSVATTHQLTVSWWYVPTVTDNYSSSGGEMDYINMLGKGAGGEQTEWTWTLGGQNSANKPWEIAFYAQSLDGGSGNGGGIYKSWKPDSDRIFCVGTLDMDTQQVRVEIYYPDGTVGVDTNNFDGLKLAKGNGPLMIGTGWASNPDQAYKGNLDELEICNKVQPDAWIKATYYSQCDKLLSYGSSDAPFQKRYESFTAQTANTSIGGNVERGQSFTPSVSHILQEIRIKIMRTTDSASGDLLVNIRGTDSSGMPVGPVLSSGSISCKDINGSSYQVYSISVSDLVLSAGSKYAILLSAPSLQSGDIAINIDEKTVYDKGNELYSNDSGVSWEVIMVGSLYFEEWGLPVVTLS